MARGRRSRSPHPGVYPYVRPAADGRTLHYVKYQDPASGGKWRKISLSAIDGLADALPDGTPDPDAGTRRLEYAIELSRRLRDFRSRAGSGPAAVSGWTAIADAVAMYYRGKTGLAAATVRSYRQTTDLALEWWSLAGIGFAQQITPPTISALTDWIRERYSGEGRSLRSANHHLGQLRAVLNWWRKRGFCPDLTRDAIADRIEMAAPPIERPDVLQPGAIHRVLAAASRYDRLHPAPGIVAAWTAWLLMTGTRRRESLELQWAWFSDDLTVVDLPSAATKNRRWRRIHIGVISPGLVGVLQALRDRADGRSPVVFPMATGKRMSVDYAGKVFPRMRRATAGCPDVRPQLLRQTCSSYLANAPRIWEAASAALAAEQLGHSLDVCQRHYLGLVPVPREATTLDDAMGVAGLLAALAARLGGGRRSAATARRGA